MIAAGSSARSASTRIGVKRALRGIGRVCGLVDGGALARLLLDPYDRSLVSSITRASIISALMVERAVQSLVGEQR
jgi:hypothetical protein